MFVGLLAALSWADIQAVRPGICLFPVALVVGLLAAEEMHCFFREIGKYPVRWTFCLGSVLPVATACAPIAWEIYPQDSPVGRLGWVACGVSAGFVVVLVAEMGRYAEPGKAMSYLSAAGLSILYVGCLLGFMVQLRLLPVGGDVHHGGMLAVLSMIAVVKATDVGAYFCGRLWGRTKMAPVLSPSKTWEGIAGGVVCAVAAAFFSLSPLAALLGVTSKLTGTRWVAAVVAYGLIVSIAGIIGDLAESLLKRDAGMKDSSTWLPGFGGVLDILDSLLVAAPAAYFCWVSGLLGF